MGSLPMSDASALALLELLLDGSTPQIQRWIDLLQADPPLLVWTVATASQRETFRPRSLLEVAQWFSLHAVEILQWPHTFVDHPTPPPPATDQQSLADARPTEAAPAATCHFPVGSSVAALRLDADRVASTLEVAELASQLAAGEDKETAQLVRFAALLHNAEDWLIQAEHQSPSVKRLWEIGLHDTQTPSTDPRISHVADIVQRARAVLHGDAALPDKSSIDLEACRQRAAQIATQWQADRGKLASRLPMLTATLGRLATLETRFQEAVEYEKLESMAEFAAGAGHEINNPLTVITGRAQLFLSDEKDPERRRALALISAQANRVYEMIADMMLFARPPQPECSSVEIGQLIDQVIESLSPRAHEQQTILLRTDSSQPCHIEADATQIMVALRAVCQNALEALGNGGRIEIALRPAGGSAEIRIADNGPGMTQQERRHIFDPYYSARQAGRGLGLGLSKCWRIVTNHGGRIHVDSESGRGSTFSLVLPRQNLTSQGTVVRADHPATGASQPRP